MRIALSIMLCAAALSGCGPNSSDGDDNGPSFGPNSTVNQSDVSIAAAPAAAENAARTVEVPALTPADRPVPGLGTVSMADVQRELEPGAGCELRTSDGMLLVATGKAAIARPRNKLTKLRFEGNELWDGGAFRAGDLAIRISPLAKDGKVVDEVTSRPAQAIVEADGKRETVSGQWACGA